MDADMASRMDAEIRRVNEIDSIAIAQVWCEVEDSNVCAIKLREIMANDRSESAGIHSENGGKSCSNENMPVEMIVCFI